MAQVVLRNTREHDINISLLNPKTQEIATIIIPGARPSERDANTLVPGETVADESAVDSAIQKYQVVKHYFDAGWLEKVGGGVQAAPKAKAAAPAATGE